MIGLDTNVLVRYIAQDDPEQAATASELMHKLSVAAPGFITMVSLVEMVWVLQSCYHSSKGEVAQTIDTLLRTRVLAVERADIVWQALRRFQTANADFADCLIERCSHAAGCGYTVTFDRKAAKTTGMRVLG